ncbi:MAG: hypothetical protein M0R51_05275 [Clostridia bacterium]|nr:hypothetical protein [Clostridia bacterium]
MMKSLKKFKPEETITLAEIVADKICSGHNQHMIIFLEGKTGAGKSNAANRLCYDTSLLFAERMGGRPEDYYNVDHIAVMTMEEVFRVAKNMKKFGIYNLDDIGAEGMTARNWQSDVNEVMTKLLQTFRTKNNLLVMSSPSRDFVDKIARTLLHYKITMVKAWYDRGISLGKLSTVQKMYHKDGSNNIYPFVRHKGVVYNYTAFKLAPDHIRKPYEAKRDRLEEEMNSRSMQEAQDKMNGTKDEMKTVQNEIKSSKKFAHAQAYVDFLSQGYKSSEANNLASGVSGVKQTVRTTQYDIKKFQINAHVQ